MLYRAEAQRYAGSRSKFGQYHFAKMTRFADAAAEKAEAYERKDIARITAIEAEDERLDKVLS